MAAARPGRNRRTFSKSEGARVAGIDFAVPPVVDYACAFARKKGTNLIVAINEIRHSKNATCFRKWCSELDTELLAASGRSSLSSHQKIVAEIENLVAAWETDLNLEIKYKRREVSLRKVWGLGELLEGLQLSKFYIKDPVIVPEKPYLLFLNDLYRAP